jgi:hypothetical protein
MWLDINAVLFSMGVRQPGAEAADVSSLAAQKLEQVLSAL